MSKLIFPSVMLIAVALMACQKNNDIVAQEQIRESQQGCPEGCTVPPPGCAIKGNISNAGNRFYHVPGGFYYDGVIVDPAKGELWFCKEAEAVNNGFTKSFR